MRVFPLSSDYLGLFFFFFWRDLSVWLLKKLKKNRKHLIYSTQRKLVYKLERSNWTMRLFFFFFLLPESSTVKPATDLIWCRHRRSKKIWVYSDFDGSSIQCWRYVISVSILKSKKSLIMWLNTSKAAHRSIKSSDALPVIIVRARRRPPLPPRQSCLTSSFSENKTLHVSD